MNNTINSISTIQLFMHFITIKVQYITVHFVNKKIEQNNIYIQTQEMQQSNPSPHKITIEYCKSCDTHNWCTHHSEQRYRLAYVDLNYAIGKQFPGIEVVANQVPGHLVPIKARENKYYDSKDKRYVIFPAIGAFEVCLDGELIFSKKSHNIWPTNSQILNQIHLKLYGIPRKSEASGSATSTQKFNNISQKQQKDTVKMATNILINMDRNSTFHKEKSQEKSRKQLTLTDHFKKYKMHNKIDDDQISLYAESEKPKGSRISKITPEDIKNLHSLWGKKENLPNFIKDKAFIQLREGKKEMLINLSSIEEENQLKGDVMAAPSKNRKNVQFQKLENRMLKFQTRVSEVNNKKFIFQPIQQRKSQLKNKPIKSNQLNFVSKINQVKTAYNAQKLIRLIKDKKKRKIQQYIHATSEQKNEKLEEIYGPQYMKTNLASSKVKFIGNSNSNSKGSSGQWMRQRITHHQDRINDNQLRKKLISQNSSPEQQQHYERNTESEVFTQAYPMKRETNSALSPKKPKNNFNSTQSSFKPQIRPIYTREKLTSNTNNFESSKCFANLDKERRMFQSRSLLHKPIYSKYGRANNESGVNLRNSFENNSKITQSNSSPTNYSQFELRESEVNGQNGKIAHNFQRKTQNQGLDGQAVTENNKAKLKLVKTSKKQNKNGHGADSIQRSRQRTVDKIYEDKNQNTRSVRKMSQQQQRKSSESPKKYSPKKQTPAKKNTKRKNKTKPKHTETEQQKKSPYRKNKKQLKKQTYFNEQYQEQQDQNQQQQQLSQQDDQEQNKQNWQDSNQPQEQKIIQKSLNKSQSKHSPKKQPYQNEQVFLQNSSVSYKSNLQKSKKESKNLKKQKKESMSLQNNEQIAQEQERHNQQQQDGHQKEQKYQIGCSQQKKQGKSNTSKENSKINDKKNTIYNDNQKEDEMQKYNEGQDQSDDEDQDNNMENMDQNENQNENEDNKEDKNECYQQITPEQKHQDKQKNMDQSSQAQIEQKQQIVCSNDAKIIKQIDTNSQKTPKQSKKQKQNTKINHQNSQTSQKQHNHQQNQQQHPNQLTQSHKTQSNVSNLKPQQQKQPQEQAQTVTKPQKQIIPQNNVGQQSKPRRIFEIFEERPEIVDVTIQCNLGNMGLEKSSQTKKPSHITEEPAKQIQNKNYNNDSSLSKQYQPELKQKQGQISMESTIKETSTITATKTSAFMKKKSTQNVHSFQQQQQQQQNFESRIMKNTKQNASITKQFYGPYYNQILQQINNQPSPNLNEPKNPNKILINKLYPSTCSSQTHKIFEKDTIQHDLLHDTTGRLTNFLKIIKILCDKNQFLIIRLFQNPQHHKMENYSVWLCDQHTWKYFTVSHTTVDDSKMPAIHHQGLQLWGIILVEALLILFGGMDKLGEATIVQLFHALTGSNYISFRVKEDLSKNSKLLRFIAQNEKKNFILSAQKRMHSSLAQSMQSLKQPTSYFILAQKTVNDQQILLRMKKGNSQAFWLKLQKFVTEFSQVDILQLRVNHNFGQILLTECVKGNFKIIELGFEEECFGCVVAVAQGNGATDFRLFLYREEDDSVLRLVGQVSDKNRKMTFFDCCFEQGKYLLFVDSKCSENKICYMGEGRPQMTLKQQIKEIGLKSDYTQYIPISSAPQRKQPQMPKFINMTRKSQKSSVFGVQSGVKSGIKGGKGVDKEKLRSQFVDYLIHG